MFRITILIPFYNEEGNIIRQLKDIVENIEKIKNYKFNILLVDDGSTDQGSIKIEKFINQNKNFDIKLIKHLKNLGKTKAFESAFQVIDTDFILFMDGDYQDDPNEIPELYNMIVNDGYHLVSGWKKKRLDPVSKTTKNQKHIKNYMFL